MIEHVIAMQNYINFCEYCVSDDEILDLIKEIYKYLMIFPLRCGNCKRDNCDCHKTYFRRKNLYVHRHFRFIKNILDVVTMLDIYIKGEAFKFYEYSFVELGDDMKVIDIDFSDNDVVIKLSSRMSSDGDGMVLNLCHDYDPDTTFSWNSYNPKTKIDLKKNPWDRNWIYEWKFNYIILRRVHELLRSIYLKYKK